MSSLDAPPLTGLSILVVEDEALIAMALKTYFLNAGASSIQTANSLTEARLVCTETYDAAILDVWLPDGMSYDLAAELLEAQTAVTFYSGFVDVDTMDKFPTATFCGKPSTPSQLAKAVQTSITAMQT